MSKPRKPRKPRALTGHAFAAMLQSAGLTIEQAAVELDMSERMLRYYLSGAKPVPKVVQLALSAL